MEYKSKIISLAGKIIFFTEICLIMFIFQQGLWRLTNWLVSKNSASNSYDISSCLMIDDNSLLLAIFALWLGLRLAFYINFHKNNLLSFNFILSLLVFLSTVYYENCLGKLNSDFSLASFEINSFRLPYLSLFFLALVIYRLLPESYRKRLALVEEKIYHSLSELYRTIKTEPNQEVTCNDFPTKEAEKFTKAQNILAKEILLSMQNDLDSRGAIVYSLESKWGAGKTSFLKLIKEKTTDTKFVYKEYKAWLQDSESNIRDDFFKFLAEIAQDQISTQTANKILNYANSLKQLDNKLVNFLMSLFDRKPDQVRYEEIEEDLRYYERPLLIVIDDLDRLNREEILEVLKIVRSSANFPYLAFLLLYDRSYINKIIENEKYLEKIVNCEFKLPSYSTEKMSLELVNNFTGNFSNASLGLGFDVDHQKILSLIRQNHFIINKILRTIRDQKRFFKSLRLKYLLFFKTKSYGKENNTIIAWTLFLLELIQYDSPEIFEKIKNRDPDYLISNSKDKFFNYVFQSGSSCIFRMDRKKDLIQEGNSSGHQPLGNGLPETTPDYIIECFKLLNKVKEIYNTSSRKTNKQNDYPMLISKSDCFRFFFEFGFNDEMFSLKEISEEIENLVALKNDEGHSASEDTYYAALHGLGMKILANSDRNLIKDSFNQIISSLTFQNLDQAKVLIDLFLYRYYQARLHSGTDASLIEDLLPIFYDSLTKLLIRVNEASEEEFKILKTYILKNFMPQDKLLEKLYFLIFKLHELGIEDSLFKEEIEEAIKETDTVLNDSNSQQLLKQYMELNERNLEADFGYMFQLIDNIQAKKKKLANYRSRAVKSLIEASVVQEYTLKSFLKSFLEINENPESSGESDISLKLVEVPYTYPPYYFSRFLLFMGMTTDFSHTRIEKSSLKQLISDRFEKDYTEELLGKYSYANQYLDEFLVIIDQIVDASVQIDDYVDCKEEFKSITRKTILN